MYVSMYHSWPCWFGALLNLHLSYHMNLGNCFMIVSFVAFVYHTAKVIGALSTQKKTLFCCHVNFSSDLGPCKHLIAVPSYLSIPLKAQMGRVRTEWHSQLYTRTGHSFCEEWTKFTSCPLFHASPGGLTCTTLGLITLNNASWSHWLNQTYMYNWKSIKLGQSYMY